MQSIPLPGAGDGPPARGASPDAPVPLPPAGSSDPFAATPPPREPTPSLGIDFDLSLPPDAAANPFAEAPPATERTPTPTPGFDFDLSLPPGGADAPALDEFDFGFGAASDEAPRPTPTAEYSLGPAPEGSEPAPIPEPPAFDSAFDLEPPPPEPGGLDLTIPPMEDYDPDSPTIPGGSVEDDLRAFLGAPVLPPPPQQIVPATVGVVGKAANEPIFHVRRQTGKRIGPFDRDTLIRLVRQDQLDGSEEISETGEDWVPLSDLPEVAQLLQVRPEPKRSQAPMLQPVAKKSDEAEETEEGAAPKAPEKPASRWLAKPVKTVSRDELEDSKPSRSALRRALIIGGAVLGIAIPAAALWLIGGDDGPSAASAAARDAKLAQIRAALLRDNLAATQEALALSTELVQAFPEDQLALSLQTRASFAMKRRFEAGGVGPDMAREKLQKLEPALKEEPAWRMAAAAASFTFGKTFEHKGWLEELARENPRDPEPVALLAEGSHRVGDRKGAASWYAKLLEIVPASPLALHALAQLQVEEGDLEAATANFEKALEADPQHASSALALARLASDRGDTVEALRQLDRALTDDASKGLGSQARAKGHLARARLLLRSQQPAAAEEALQQALAADANFRDAQLLLTRMWNARGRQADTIRLLTGPQAKPEGEVLTELVLAYLSSGKTSEPALLVQPLLKAQPKSPLPHYLQGKIHEAGDKDDAAVASFLKALELDPDHVPSLTDLARSRSSARDFEGARSHLAHAAKVAPQSVVPGLTLGDVLLEAGDPDAALEAFDAVRALDPVSELAEVGRGRALAARGKMEAAQAAFERALELNPDAAEVQFAWGTHLRRVCGSPDARTRLAICAPVVEAAPKPAIAAKAGAEAGVVGNAPATDPAAGAVADAVGKGEEEAPAAEPAGGAVADLAGKVDGKEAPAADPTAGTDAEAAGNAAAPGRDPAWVAFEKARSLAPSNPAILRALGATLLDLGQTQEALDSISQALVLDSDSAEGHYLRSKILLVQDDPRGAQSAIERALSLESDNPEMELQLGRVLEGIGNQAEALAAYRRSLALRPGFLEALEGQGRTLLAMGATGEAVRSFEAALERSPDRLRLLVQIGDIHARSRGQRKALSTYEEAEKLGATGLAFKMARAHLDLGNTSQAIVLLRRAVKDDPENAEAWRFLGYAYKEKNNRGDAREAFRTYLERRPEAKDRDEILDEIAGLR